MLILSSNCTFIVHAWVGSTPHCWRWFSTLILRAYLTSARHINTEALVGCIVNGAVTQIDTAGMGSNGIVVICSPQSLSSLHSWARRFIPSPTAPNTTSLWSIVVLLLSGLMQTPLITGSTTTNFRAGWSTGRSQSKKYNVYISLTCTQLWLFLYFYLCLSTHSTWCRYSNLAAN